MGGDGGGETELARAILEGGDDHEAAEAKLCKLLAPRIHLFALRHLRSQADAADVTQDALAIVLRALRDGKVEDPHHIASFAFGISRNLILHVLRGERTRATHPTPLAAVESTIEGIAGIRLQRCFESLQERVRLILRMTFYDDCTSEEISKATGLTVANVRVIRHRALIQLRNCLGRGAPS